VSNDQKLFRRAFACHDMGYPRDENGRLYFSDPDLCLWGKGCRLDELRASILRVQLTRLPNTIGAMRTSKYRIREALQKYRQFNCAGSGSGRGHGLLPDHHLPDAGDGAPDQ